LGICSWKQGRMQQSVVSLFTLYKVLFQNLILVNSHNIAMRYTYFNFHFTHVGTNFCLLFWNLEQCLAYGKTPKKNVSNRGKRGSERLCNSDRVTWLRVEPGLNPRSSEPQSCMFTLFHECWKEKKRVEWLNIIITCFTILWKQIKISEMPAIKQKHQGQYISCNS